MANELIITLCGAGGSLAFRDIALKTFCGKPISHYSLAAALLFLQKRSDLRADIVLNTDSGLLRETVTGLYPEVIPLQRPAALADAPRLDVFRQSVREMEERRGSMYDYHINLDIAAPLRRVSDIEACFSALEARPELDAVIAASKTHLSPYTSYAKRAGDHVERLIRPDDYAEGPPPDCYDLHGAVCCFRRDFLARESGGLIWEANCDVLELPSYFIEGLDATAGFPFYEAIARQLYQTDPDYKQIRAAVR